MLGPNPYHPALKHFGYGTRELATRFLAHLNRHRAVNHYSMDRVADLFPTPTLAELESSPDRVDMLEEVNQRRR